MMKYHRTVLQIEILSASETPPDVEGMDLKDIDRELTTGGWSGKSWVSEQKEVTPQRMVELAEAQGSDSEFFGLTPDGQPIDN